MSLMALIAQYGYIVIFVGCMLEGETILILSGFAAFQGYLSFPLIIFFAVLGGTIGDQLFFFLGRYYGTALLNKYPRINKQSARVNTLIVNHQNSLIIGIRFMYGLRVAGPILLGMSKVSTWRFISLNVLGAFIWALVIGSIGYFFGTAIESVMADIKKSEEAIALLIIVACVCVGFFRWFYHKKKNDKNSASQH